jgi:hypothetical protein
MGKRIRITELEPETVRISAKKDGSQTAVIKDRTKNLNGNKVNLLLDSGAFSAWSRGEEIDIKKYIRYLRDNEKLLWNYVTLDKIPGEFGKRDNSQEEVERSASQSYKNQQRMKDAGLRPVPVFHQGERLHWLQKYLEDNEPYIGLSASKFVRIDEQQRWLDSVFNLLTDDKGHPYVKTHGFALTSFTHLTAYPWYTVDSTTWSMTPGYGQIIIPAWKGGRYDYLAPPVRIAISGVTHTSPTSQKKQFEALGDVTQEVVRRYLEDVVGCSVTEARYGTNFRRQCMLTYYKHLCEALRDVTFTGLRASLSGKDHRILEDDRYALRPFNLTLTHATALNREWSDLMTRVGANDRLLSYYELQDRGNEILEQYVTTGMHGPYRQQPIKVGDWDSETYLNRRRLALYYRLQQLNKQAEQENVPW